MANPTPPSIPKPTSSGTTDGQVGGSAADGSWTWSSALGDWVWHSAGGDPSQHITANGTGTPTPEQMGGDFSDKRSVEQRIADAAKGMFLPYQIGANAPGASLDTSYADDQRARTEALLSQLQQQATSGDGAWRDSFAKALQRAQANASALGQAEANQGRSGYADALRNIGNAQSAAAQRGVGEEAVLRNEAEIEAQNQLGQVLGNVGAGDISQAAQSAAVNQQRREANTALVDQSEQQAMNMASAAGQAAMGASRGGRVPGRAAVFGDDETNDTVPAMLSPGEIVVPRSKARSPQAAADFARAVAERGGRRSAAGFADAVFERRGVQALAGGGDAGGDDTGVSYAAGPTPTQLAEIAAAPHIGLHDYYSSLKKPQAPSIENGGLLNLGQYNDTRGQMDQLGSLLGVRAGGGNSIADVLGQQQEDETMGRAMAALNDRRQAAADALQTAAEEGAKTAGRAGAKRGEEQAAGQRSLAGLLEQRRAQEQALAEASQRQAWNNTLMNAQLNLQNQQFLRNQLAGAGQVAAGLAAAGKGESEEDPFKGAPGFDDQGNPVDSESGSSSSSSSGSDLGDYNPPDVSGGAAAWRGGRVVARRMAVGGYVPPPAGSTGNAGFLALQQLGGVPGGGPMPNQPSQSSSAIPAHLVASSIPTSVDAGGPQDQAAYIYKTGLAEQGMALGGLVFADSEEPERARVRKFLRHLERRAA